MTDLLTDADFRTRTASKPPARWQNFWNVGEDACLRCDRCTDAVLLICGPATDVSCGCTYPSRDVAETAAFEDLADATAKGLEATYLGARPLDPDPEV